MAVVTRSPAFAAFLAARRAPLAEFAPRIEATAPGSPARVAVLREREARLRDLRDAAITARSV